MTLTVRLDPTLEAALDRYCASTGSSKSHVVQESLAAYLVAKAQESSTDAQDAGAGEPPSAAFLAFADAGLVGAVALSVPGVKGSADKAAVRAQIAARRAAQAARAQPARRNPA